MAHIKLPRKIKNILTDFTMALKAVYREGLISVILYGSGASGEFIERRSNLNILAVLKNTDLENLKAASGIVGKFKFRIINPVFFTEEYIKSAIDVFPIEFLDMKENYIVLEGRDILKGITIEKKNLRFQCEQELKAKLIYLRGEYLRAGKNKVALHNLLFRAFTSIMHILRSVLRLKGKEPLYLKQNILMDISVEFPIDKTVWEKILAAKNKKIKLNIKEAEYLLISLTKDLEKIINIVDRF